MRRQVAHHESQQDESADKTDIVPQQPRVPPRRYVFGRFDRRLGLAVGDNRLGTCASSQSSFLLGRARWAREFPSHLAQHCREIARIDAISIHYRQSHGIGQNVSKRWFTMNLIHRSAVADRIQLLPPQTLTASAILRLRARHWPIFRRTVAEAAVMEDSSEQPLDLEVLAQWINSVGVLFLPNANRHNANL